MIESAIFKRFSGIKEAYNENSTNWYAYAEVKDITNTYFIIKGKNVWIIKKRRDLDNIACTPFKLKEEFSNKLMKDFRVKKINKDVLLKYTKNTTKEEFPNTLLEIIRNSDIPEDKNSDIRLEGPIYVKHDMMSVKKPNIKPSSSNCRFGPIEYFSVYLPGRIDIDFVGDESKEGFYRMDETLLRKLDEKHRNTFN